MNKEELESAFNETTNNAVNLLKENVELKNRIDKAVKYIENNSHSNIKMNFIDKSGKIKCEFDNNVDPRDLLDILQGSDKEWVEKEIICKDK